MKIRLLLPVFCLLLLASLPDCQPNPYRDGEAFYKQYCANCHLDNGEGLAGLIPPLAGADYLRNNREKLPCIVRHGLEGEIVVNGRKFSEQMAGIKTANDVEITNVLNFINNAWGNQNGVYKLEEVQQFLKNCSR